jgi:hypothetical protein
MSETENKKPTISKLSIFLIFIPVILTTIFFFLLKSMVMESPKIIIVLLVILISLSLCFGIILGIISVIQIKKSKGKLKGIFFSLIAIFFCIYIAISLLTLILPKGDDIDFNDDHVKFIKTEDVNNLKWK